MFFTDPFFQTFVILKRKLTPDHNIAKFSTGFTRLGLVLRWIHNTLTTLWCSFIINKRTDDKETSVNVMNWTNFSAWDYYLTYYFTTSSYVAEITHPFAGADRGSLRMPTLRYTCLPLPCYCLTSVCMSTSVWKSVTNPQLLVCRQRSPQWARCWGILVEDVKITHFERVYVQ